MGQTLTHGVYLPDEGERNCYNGLAGNWQLLDGAVGTVAEHTSALAGKAPLVHTHTKSQITDFPAYGTAAGTICEGNDSRLSDARTPVAHTHTKSDVTDLFNSVNEWTGDNTFSNALNVQTGYTLGTLPQAESAVALFTGRAIDNNFVISVNFYQSSTKGTGLRFTIRNKWDNNGYSTTGNRYNAHFELLQSINKIAYMQWAGYVNNGLYPLANNTYDLGTSTNKWKSLNGINPGALSLPDYTLAKVDLIDFSQWSVSGQRNEYTPVSDGWLFVNIKDTASNSIFIYAHSLYNSDPTKATDYSASCFGNGSQGLNGRIAVMIPVRAGIVYGIIIKAASVSEIFSAKFYPALGNV